MKKNTILIFAYYSFYDPVFQSAVLPYFREFPGKKDFHFVLITFEQKKYRTSEQQRADIKEELQKQNITWYNVNWHSGSFKVLKKLFDFIVGICFTAYLIIKYKVNIIYSEAFPGAIISHFLSRFFRVPHIVHSFEPHTDYMVEAGVWSEKSWEAVLLKTYEKKIALKCYAIFTATGKMIERLRQAGVKCIIEKVPSCVDINHFKYRPDKREAIRNSLGIKDEECVIVYLGKFGGMYLDSEVFDFYAYCLKYSRLQFRLLIFTPDDYGIVKEFIREKELDESLFVIGTLKKEDIPSYLSAADFGLVPVRQKPSKRFCSPIKDGEYWACGLPIIIPEGISDDYIYAEQYGIGISVKDFTDKSLIEVVKQIDDWMANKSREDVRYKARKFVEQDRNVEHYKLLYRKVFLQVGQRD